MRPGTVPISSSCSLLSAASDSGGSGRKQPPHPATRVFAAASDAPVHADSTSAPSCSGLGPRFSELKLKEEASKPEVVYEAFSPKPRRELKRMKKEHRESAESFYIQARRVQLANSKQQRRWVRKACAMDRSELLKLSFLERQELMLSARQLYRKHENDAFGKQLCQLFAQLYVTVGDWKMALKWQGKACGKTRFVGTDLAQVKEDVAYLTYQVGFLEIVSQCLARVGSASPLGAEALREGVERAKGLQTTLSVSQVRFPYYEGSLFLLWGCIEMLRPKPDLIAADQFFTLARSRFVEGQAYWGLVEVLKQLVSVKALMGQTRDAIAYNSELVQLMDEHARRS